jgi:hypothetical protein
MVKISKRLLQQPSKALLLVLVLGLFGLGVSGCGTPGPGKVLDSAIEWIQDSDCQAISNPDLVSGAFDTQSWWLYQKGGRTLTGLAGNLIIDGDTFFVREITPAASTEGQAPRWVRFLRQDLSDEDTLAKAKDLLVSLVGASLTEPLNAMQGMVPDPEVGETADKTAWIVTGKVTTAAQLELLFGKQAATKYLEAGFEPESERMVTVIVNKKTGRPLDTTIQVGSGAAAVSFSYSWMRGLWLPADEDTVDLNEFLK